MRTVRVLEKLRVSLIPLFLVGYFWTILFPDGPGEAVVICAGLVILVLSLPGSGWFHRGLAVAAVAAFLVSLVTGHYDGRLLYEGLPSYFAIVAILQVVSLAGYPIRAERFESSIRALMSVLARRGSSAGTTSGLMTQALGSVLDVGAYVLVDVVFSKAAPASRLRALVWSARSFSFVILWTNLNLLTATAITLTGASYAGFLQVSLPYFFVGLACMILFAQREKGGRIEVSEDARLDNGAFVVVLYPVSLIVAVALFSHFVPSFTLTASIAITVAVAVAGISLLAAALTMNASPLTRVFRETRASFGASSPEFALFGSAGILVLSLESLGALRPLGTLLSGVPEAYLPIALFFVVAVGFIVGIHVLPMVLLIDSAFPLSAAGAPEIWSLAIILGCQGALLTTPFSNSVTMISRLSGKGPFEIGPATNWRFALATTAGSLVYLALLTALT